MGYLEVTDTTTVNMEYGKWDWRLHSEDPNQQWETKPALLGIAKDEDDADHKVFGIVYYGEMSYMSYRVDDLTPVEDFKRKYFYFDAGGNGRPIRLPKDELEKAYRTLGLLKDE